MREKGERGGKADCSLDFSIAPFLFFVYDLFILLTYEGNVDY